MFAHFFSGYHHAQRYDIKKAIEYFKIASSLGHEEAQIALNNLTTYLSAATSWVTSWFS